MFVCCEHHEFGERVGPVYASLVPAGFGVGSVFLRASQKASDGGIVSTQRRRAQTSQKPRSGETRSRSAIAKRGETDIKRKKTHHTIIWGQPKLNLHYKASWRIQQHTYTSLEKVVGIYWSFLTGIQEIVAPLQLNNELKNTWEIFEDTGLKTFSEEIYAHNQTSFVPFISAFGLLTPESSLKGQFTQKFTFNHYLLFPKDLMG